MTELPDCWPVLPPQAVSAIDEHATKNAIERIRDLVLIFSRTDKTDTRSAFAMAAHSDSAIGQTPRWPTPANRLGRSVVRQHLARRSPDQQDDLSN